MALPLANHGTTIRTIRHHVRSLPLEKSSHARLTSSKQRSPHHRRLKLHIGQPSWTLKWASPYFPS